MGRRSIGVKGPLGRIRVRRALLPALLGLAVVGWMFWRDFDPSILDGVRLNARTSMWLLVALCFTALREIGYMARLRVLSGRELSWLQSFRVVMLWEFTSAITPSSVGGTGVAMVYVHKEGIGLGRSSAIVMVTSLLDELYFLVMFPALFLMIGFGNMFEMSSTGTVIAKSFAWLAIGGYSVKFLYTCALTYGLLINPRGFKWLLMNIFRLRPLRRWRQSMDTVGTDMVDCSYEIRRQSVRYWLEAAGATFVSWTSRFMVANALIMAFFSVSDHLTLFARQLVMWIMMLVMPTPGGSGLAEIVFRDYSADLIAVPPAVQAAAAVLIASLWRLFTYYPYLIAGAIIFPRWIKSRFGRRVPANGGSCR